MTRVAAVLAVAAAALVGAPSAFAGVAIYNSTAQVHVGDNNAPLGVTSKIVVPPGRTPVQSVDLTNFTVFWPASGQEMSARIEGTDGTPVKLFDEGCFLYDPGDVWAFSDAAASLTWNDKDDPKCDLGGGTFRPLGKLSTFAGKAASGTWTLRAIDSGAQFTNQGDIKTWALRITHAPPTLNATAPKSDDIDGKLKLTVKTDADGTLTTGGAAKQSKTAVKAGAATQLTYKIGKKLRAKIEDTGKARVRIKLNFADETDGKASASVRVKLKD